MQDPIIICLLVFALDMLSHYYWDDKFRRHCERACHNKLPINPVSYPVVTKGTVPSDIDEETFNKFIKTSIVSTGRKGVEESQQYLKDLLTKKNENTQCFWTDLLVEAVAANPDPMYVKREFIEPRAAAFAQQIQRNFYLKLVDRVAELIAPKLLNLPEKSEFVHLELKVTDKAIDDFINGISIVSGKELPANG